MHIRIWFKNPPEVAYIRFHNGCEYRLVSLRDATSFPAEEAEKLAAWLQEHRKDGGRLEVVPEE